MATQSASFPVARRTPNGGCLYLVSTPIGNLEDITLRALRVLKEVDLIACEDTRETAKLLNHYGIHKRALSYHEHNEVVRAAEIVLDLEEGAKVALVADAGTPGISDPGDHLISLAIRHGIPVVPVPGATAFGAALMASGLPSGHFHFVGFLPPKRVARRKALKALAAEPATLIFYEAPHRIAEALADMAAALGDRTAVLAREVTKLHEEFLRGRLEPLAVFEAGGVQHLVPVLVDEPAAGFGLAGLGPMMDDANELGANAVVSVRFATSVIMGGAAEMLAYGTAVTIEDEEGQENR